MKTVLCLVVILFGFSLNPGLSREINPGQKAYDQNREEFCRNYGYSEKERLDSRLFHTYRGKLDNSRIIFERERRATVAFLGGSITANGGWRDSVCRYLQERFPETQFNFIPAGIPSMGSTPGAFRLERDVLAKGKVDLLFVEAAVNDRVNRFNPEEQILGMEGIVRHAREVNPSMDIVMMHFADPEKLEEYRKGVVPVEIGNHEKVAERYQISTINLAREVTARIDSGEFSWEDDFRDLHPSPFGQQVYYHSMRSFLEYCWRNELTGGSMGIAEHTLPEKLSEACYNRGVLIPSVVCGTVKGWKAEPLWTPMDGAGTRPDFTKVPMLVSQGINKILTFEFEGNAIGIAVAAGPDAGMIEYRIDKGEWRRKDLFTTWSPRLHLPFFYTLAYGLDQGRHKLEIRLIEGRNTGSTGNACRLRYFYVNMGE